MKFLDEIEEGVEAEDAPESVSDDAPTIRMMRSAPPAGDAERFERPALRRDTLPAFPAPPSSRGG